MLQFFRLVAVLSLIAPWGVTSQDWHFGCKRNVDAICRIDMKDPEKVTLKWAERLYPGKRDYKCGSGAYPICCHQGRFNINGSPTKSLLVPVQDTVSCHGGGQ
ncbi:hypothetical protein PGTUg99_014996 [Puccinia graminis f. sp. tritici]|uniref:Hydrophobin n=1 Tax=Puccinia graminis f. sp. tritici TaxID=56615 RepID=A0A5B0RZV4_PUCGR|nr:hypothetical protein PGTUg99_014996 [Puccinia graminis f. sp. tritici]